MHCASLQCTLCVCRATASVYAAHVVAAVRCRCAASSPMSERSSWIDADACATWCSIFCTDALRPEISCAKAERARFVCAAAAAASSSLERLLSRAERWRLRDMHLSSGDTGARRNCICICTGERQWRAWKAGVDDVVVVVVMVAGMMVVCVCMRLSFA